MSELIVKKLSASNKLPLKSFTAGSEFVLIPGPQGEPGPEGASAYDVAVDNGFEGSETEWLASLKGEKGADGKIGADGISPAATVETNEIGAIVTITDKNGTTTAQLKNGEKGAAGPQGPQGPAGESGVYIGDTPPVSANVWINPKATDTSSFTTVEQVQALINASLVEVENGSY